MQRLTNTIWGKKNIKNYLIIGKYCSLILKHMHTHKSGEVGCALFVTEDDLPFPILNSMNLQSYVIA